MSNLWQLGKRSAKTGVHAWIDHMLEMMWQVTQTMEAWRMIDNRQSVHIKVLGLIEKQGREVSERNWLGLRN